MLSSLGKREHYLLADEYVLMHKAVFPFSLSAEKSHFALAPQIGQPTPSFKKEERDCFYCHKPDHVIANCLTLKRKEQLQAQQSVHQPKGIGLIKSEPKTSPSFSDREAVEECFKPFISDGLVSLTGSPADQCPVRILRDTACSQSVILSSSLPFSEKPACGYGSVLRRVGMGYVLTLVHVVHVESKLITGFFPVAVCSELPINGVDFLLGNDIAGGKVTPALEVLGSPQRSKASKVELLNSGLYPACAVACAQAAKNDEAFLSDSVLQTIFSGEVEMDKETETAATPPGDAAELVASATAEAPASNSLSLSVTRDRLRAAQRADPKLQKCFFNVVSNKQVVKR